MVECILCESSGSAFNATTSTLLLKHLRSAHKAKDINPDLLTQHHIDPSKYKFCSTCDLPFADLSTHKCKLGQNCVNSRIGCYFKVNDAQVYFHGTITEFDPDQGYYTVLYEDNESAKYPREDIEPMLDHFRKKLPRSEHEEILVSETQSTGESISPSSSPSKRRKRMHSIIHATPLEPPMTEAHAPSQQPITDLMRDEIAAKRNAALQRRGDRSVDEILERSWPDLPLSDGENDDDDAAPIENDEVNEAGHAAGEGEFRPLPKGFALPPFDPVMPCQGKFNWGDASAEEWIYQVTNAFDHTARFRKNIFVLPSGAAGKAFVRSKQVLFDSMSKGNPLEGIAMKAQAIMEPLLLQIFNRKAKKKEQVKVFTKRMELWKRGAIDELLTEAIAIQARLAIHSPPLSPEQLSRKFAAYMFAGNTRAALRLLDDSPVAGMQEITDEVFNTLKALHPDPEPVDPCTLYTDEVPTVHPIIFEELTGESIRKAALHTFGSAGVSGGDAQHWKRILISFKDTSSGLCDAMAAMGRRICTEYIDPHALEAFLANRLIALHKFPGTRPIGIGETARRIIGKAIMKVIGAEVREAAGTTQMCAGQEAGIEAVIHAMTKVFKADETCDPTHGRRKWIQSAQSLCRPPQHSIQMSFNQHRAHQLLPCSDIAVRSWHE